MSSRRPEILFPLFAEVSSLDGIGPKTGQLLAKIGIERVKDMVFTLPAGGTDRQLRGSIQGMTFPAVATVEVEIGKHFPPGRKGLPYRILVRDDITDFYLVFFHAREDWLRRTFPSGQRRIVSGKIELFDGVAQMVHPDHVLPVGEAASLPPFEPTYPLTAGVTNKAMFKAARAALERVPDLAEWIDSSIVAQHQWPNWRAALLAAHSPQAASDAGPQSPARIRLAYDELLSHQITLAIARSMEKQRVGVTTTGTGKLSQKVLASLPYPLTGAQARSVAEITGDMALPIRMNRLLQGDVGAGKTLVAFLAMLAAIEAGGQAAIMAPTEILARQHLEALQPLAKTVDVRLELLTGRHKGNERAERLKRIADGTADIVIGTHALFQKDVVFRDLRLAVVDEQHRFGVRQRMELGAKGQKTDILVMTATPIPRSLALAQYGDMDVSVLDEKPPGRKPIETVLVGNTRMAEVVERLRGAIAQGRQAYWVCPLVEESEVVDMTAAEERFRMLRAALGEGVVGLVHGQMPTAEKDASMAAFVSGETRVLVATTVIEVGVNVPAATIMVIEQAEHFGLAQLHQLRGRVGRGAEASTCLLLYAPPLGETARRRLQTMRETEDGFRIAEIDLQLRGSGDLLGVQQSGLPRFRIADIDTQTDLMQLAQRDARLFLERDPRLESERGRAIRTLLHLMDRDQSMRLLKVG